MDGRSPLTRASPAGDTRRAVLGTTVGSYEVIAKIAEGGMGAVYRAQHRLIGKPAAIKVILPELSANQELVNRFFNEARAASTIHHPGIVEIFDFGYLPTGLAFIVMEFLEGEPLTRRIVGRGRLDERTALAILRGIASALAAAHAKGIIHRDLKPDNIYLVPDPDVPGGERPKLLDFGIAKLTEQGASALQTRSGAMMGTPAYMSPEQCRGAGGVDARSDLYALGCILYEMLTGRTPFVAEGVGELIAAHLMHAPTPPRALVPELSTTTEALVLQLLGKRPEDRVQSASELAKLLGQGSMPQLPERAAMQAVAAAMSPTSPRVPTGSQVQMTPHAPTPLPGSRPVGPTGSMGSMGSSAALALGQSPTTLSSATTSSPGLSELDDGAPRRSRAGLFAALGAFVVVGGVVAAVLAMGGGSKPAAPAAVPPAPEVATPAVAIDAGAATATAPAVAVDAGAAVAVTPSVDAGAASAASATSTSATSTSATSTSATSKSATSASGGAAKGKGKGGGKGGGSGSSGKGGGSGTVVPIETEL